MALDTPLVRDGSQNVLSTNYDARRSSITGTTLNGPNGSAQFFPVFMSTTVDRTVNLSTGNVNGSTNNSFYGILQNTPGPGLAADIGIFGITKAIAGTTTIIRGNSLQVSSTSGGYVTPWAGGNGPKIGFAIETPTVVGQVFSMMLYGAGQGAGST